MQTITGKLALGLLAGVSLLLACAAFSNRADKAVPPQAIPRTAVVFTGQYDRIHKALHLFATDQIDRLLVSGVNAKAGLDVGTFAEQFHLTPSQTVALAERRIILTEDAGSTLENALETRCWLKLHPETSAVTLITSPGHMRRASLALRRALPHIEVTTVASSLTATPARSSAGAREFRDYLATWAVTLLPPDHWPVDQPSICTEAGAPPFHASNG